MSKPSIVSQQEAQQFADAIAGSTFTVGGVAAVDLAHTVATEPDRIRAAVVKALRGAAGPRELTTELLWLHAHADAIENGAGW